MDVVKDVYLKECNSSMSISSNFAHLEIKSCTKTKIIFKLKQNDTGEQLFEFEFRYYVPYKEFMLKKSGVYVFKTADNDSRPYNHEIDSIMVQRGKKMQQFLIRY